MTTAASISPDPAAARDERAPDRRERTDAPGEQAQRSPYRAAFVVIALWLVMGAAFAAGCTITSGRP